MNNPTSDGIFDPGSPIKQQADGSWEINGNLRPGNKYEDQVRMTVGTPSRSGTMEECRDNRICQSIIS